MDSDDDILACFIEDSREHLTGIEATLMDIEQAGAEADPELINTVFRAAHSIKGGAGFLGLDNVRDLAHKLENVLHMVRSGELAAASHIVSRLLAGFDLLRTLAEEAHAGNSRDISAALADLSELATGHLPPESRGRLAQNLEIPLPGGHMAIPLDRLSLEQAVQGGKYLYLVEYDLIHDVHARDKTPLDVIAAMESGGLILGCQTDLLAVGDLDGPPANAIPFYVLYATIVEPDVAGYLFAIDSSRFHVVDHKALLAGSAAPAAPAMQGGRPHRLQLEGELDATALAVLKPAVLAAIAAHSALELDLARAGDFGPAFLQFVCAAHRSCHARGKFLSVTGAPPQAAARVAALGFGPAASDACLIPHCPLPCGASPS